jgi:hypothetical protein
MRCRTFFFAAVLSAASLLHLSLQERCRRDAGEMQQKQQI